MRSAFTNNMSNDLELSILSLSKIIESWGFLNASLVKFAGPSMKVSKKVSALLATKVSFSAVDGAIQKEMRGIGVVGAVHLFYINNQKFKQSPRKSLIC